MATPGNRPGARSSHFWSTNRPALDLGHALELEARLPPVQEGVERRMPPHREEAEVVGAGLQDDALARMIVAFDRPGEVRRQQEERVRRDGLDLGERAEQLDVRIEVDDAVVAEREQVREHPRLHRGAQLEDGVAKGETARQRQRQRRQRHRRAVRLRWRRRIGVDQQHEAIPRRLVPRQRRDQRPRVVPAVGSDDRERRTPHSRTVIVDRVVSRRGGTCYSQGPVHSGLRRTGAAADLDGACGS